LRYLSICISFIFFLQIFLLIRIINILFIIIFLISLLPVNGIVENAPLVREWRLHELNYIWIALVW
jgi:hypothetical protein